MLFFLVTQTFFLFLLVSQWDYVKTEAYKINAQRFLRNLSFSSKNAHIVVSQGETKIIEQYHTESDMC